MRYDDRLATVLSGADGSARARVTRWRQVIDLLAQHPATPADRPTHDAYRWLIETRAEVPLPDRMAAARAVAGRPLPTELLLFFAGDAASVAAPVVRRARLAPDAWLSILPRLGPTARALLRHRDDLPASVARALGSFGAADLIIGELQRQPERPLSIRAEPIPDRAARPAEPTIAEAPDGSGQIRQLVERIEAFRKQPKPDISSPQSPPTDIGGPFRWECGIDGLLSWTDLDRRGAVIGHALADDAGTARAVFARRPFRDAPAHLPALGSVHLSGVPVFENDGRFAGYRGTGRSVEAAAPPIATAPPPGAVREMVHELRTPLNAILGFAEMISGEYLGPAAPVQRDRADEIRAQAEQLSQALEDLDLAARLRDAKEDGGNAGWGSSDLQDMLVDEHPAWEAQARARGVALAFRIEPGLPAAAMSGEVACRLLRRMIGGAVARAGEGAVVQLAVRRDGHDAIALKASRPADDPEPDLAARAVRNLVEGIGGALLTEPGLWTLRVPAEPAAAHALAD